MTLFFKTMALVLALAMAGAATGCSGVPQDGRYQTHGNPSWDNWRG